VRARALSDNRSHIQVSHVVNFGVIHADQDASLSLGTPGTSVRHSGTITGESGSVIWFEGLTEVIHGPLDGEYGQIITSGSAIIDGPLHVDF
jgi:hypothetical protein